MKGLCAAALLLALQVAEADSDHDDHGDDEADEVESDTWVNKGGWVVLVVAVLCMFYGLAVVVEEFFVPALNTMCVKYGIPDDVAGATFMAAGASSPEMFASFISLFVTHSALGVGTIIGSELFNHLIITAGSIYYSRSGTIQCDPRLVGRESFFYLFSMIMLVWALSVTSETDDECADILARAKPVPKNLDPNGEESLEALRDSGAICVAWYKPLVLVLCFCLYALVCAKYQQLIPLFCPTSSNKEEAWKKAKAEGMDQLADNLRSTNGAFAEPLNNFRESKAVSQGILTDQPEAVDTAITMRMSHNPAFGSGDLAKPKAAHFAIEEEGEDTNMSDGPRSAKLSRGASARLYSRTISSASSTARSISTAAGALVSKGASYVIQSFAPSYVVDGATAELFEVKTDQDNSSFSCYLWKQSKYYSKIPFNPKSWQLRWVTVDKHGFRTFRARGLKQGVKAVNIYQAYDIIVVDPDRFIFCVRAKTGNTMFQAPTEQIMIAVQRVLNRYLAEYQRLPDIAKAAMYASSLKDPFNVPVPDLVGGAPPTRGAAAITAIDGKENDDDEEDHQSLMEWPETAIGMACHLILLPVKASMYYTIPDVRTRGNEEKFLAAILMSTFYLAFYSFIMTESLSLLGPLVGISDFIMGVVFAAAGTSFPNVFASMVVARQGLGNAAISNALGGNVFNIFMGLGLPWLFYCFLGSEYVEHDGTFVYYGLNAGGILFPVLLLVILLVAFILVLVSTGWVLYPVHAHCAVFLYVCFLVWVFTTSMLKPTLG